MSVILDIEAIFVEMLSAFFSRTLAWRFSVSFSPRMRLGTLTFPLDASTPDVLPQHFPRQGVPETTGERRKQREQRFRISIPLAGVWGSCF